MSCFFFVNPDVFRMTNKVAGAHDGRDIAKQHQVQR